MIDDKQIVFGQLRKDYPRQNGLIVGQKLLFFCFFSPQTSLNILNFLGATRIEFANNVEHRGNIGVTLLVHGHVNKSYRVEGLGRISLDNLELNHGNVVLYVHQVNILGVLKLAQTTCLLIRSLFNRACTARFFLGKQSLLFLIVHKQFIFQVCFGEYLVELSHRTNLNEFGDGARLEDFLFARNFIQMRIELFC